MRNRLRSNVIGARDSPLGLSSRTAVFAPRTVTFSNVAPLQTPVRWMPKSAAPFASISTFFSRRPVTFPIHIAGAGTGEGFTYSMTAAFPPGRSDSIVTSLLRASNRTVGSWRRSSRMTMVSPAVALLTAWRRVGYVPSPIFATTNVLPAVVVVTPPVFGAAGLLKNRKYAAAPAAARASTTTAIRAAGPRFFSGFRPVASVVRGPARSVSVAAAAESSSDSQTPFGAAGGGVAVSAVGVPAQFPATVDAPDAPRPAIVAVPRMLVPTTAPVAAGERFGISRSGGGGIGVATHGRSASVSWAGTW